MKELIFEVREDDADGGYVASAIGEGIHTEGESVDELKSNIRDALVCHYDDPKDTPRVVRLHFVRDEVLAL